MPTSSKQPITFGAIIHLKNSQPDGGYLDTCGWVGSKADFWNVAGTERFFVSTHAQNDRDNGSGSWQIISAQGKTEAAPVLVGDQIHLLNLYPDAGYLDCCGWVEHLSPFQHLYNTVTCGVFTTGWPDRDNGTGKWTIRAADKPVGAPLFDGDTLYLDNGLVHESRPAGSLVAHGRVDSIPALREYEGQQQLLFTSSFANRESEAARWHISLSTRNSQGERPLFDFFRPELLKGRTHNMKGVAKTTDILLSDTFQTVTAVGPADAAQLIQAIKTNPTQKSDLLASFLQKAKSSQRHQTTDAIDHDFQIKQLLNLYVLSHILNTFDRHILQELMLQSAQNHQQQKTAAPLYLFRQCFRNTVSDHEIIQRATIQRRWDQGDSYSQSIQALELLTIDKLAIKALAPFQYLLRDHADELAIIAYFSDTTHIHRVPYTDRYLLIGVSYDRVPPANNAFDAQTLTEKDFSAFELMAIPHEVGHYIYHYGSLQNGQTFAQIAQMFKENPYYHWCEELFADLYGCLVAGPLTVFSMQAFLTSGDMAQAWQHDDEHPTPMLRSYILAETLRILGEVEQAQQTAVPPHYAFTTIANKLDEDWTKLLDTWGFARVENGKHRPNRLYLPDSHTLHLEKIINVDRVLATIRPILYTFAQQLLSSYASEGQPQTATTAIPWSHEDHKDREKYAHKMAALTGWQTANEPLSLDVVLDVATHTNKTAVTPNDPDKQLQLYLNDWGDRGPHGWGGHV